MLKKLLKYETIKIFKFLSVFYILAIFFGILTKIFFNLEQTFIVSIISQICTGTTIAILVNILINSLMKQWVRFTESLYKDESYLTHTLPIKKETIYLSKVVQGLITILASALIVALTIYIAYISNNINEIKLMFKDSNIFELIKFILVILLVLYVELVNGLQSGFTGIILGHKRNNNKMVFSVIYGFITYIISQLVVLLSMSITYLISPNVATLFNSTNTSMILDLNNSTIKLVVFLATFIYIVNIIVINIINTRLLKQGVNVE